MSNPQDPQPAAGQAMFIGWADTPPADRRFFLRAGLGLTACAGGLGFGLAALQAAPGPGQWDADAVREWRGIVSAEPYAMLRTTDLDGSPRTVLLSCLGKCGVAARLGALAGQPVVVTGSLISRGTQAMVAVDEGANWIRPDPQAAATGSLAFPAGEPLGPISLVGEILDSKCWFGAMRPASGKVHKACASLCIRGGIPPAFFVRSPRGQTALLLMTSEGQAHGPELLPLVADAVRVTGQLIRRGDLLLLDARVNALRRVRDHG